MQKQSVTIVEVGPRDGLQNEARFVPTEAKIALIDRLSACGFRRIEATSFVSPRWVPQMADAADVLSRIKRNPGVTYSVLTPNLKGFDAAVRARADEVAIFASASESFSQKNINCSIAESLGRFRPLAQAANLAGLPVRGYVSCIVECPYEGAISPGAVARVTQALFALGCHEVSLGDTVGQGRPDTIAAMLDAVLDIAPAARLAGHYHDTNGCAPQSIEVSLEKGLRIFDSAVAGLGGCPYAPGAKGNVDSELVAGLVERLGYPTGLKLDELAAAARFAEDLVRVPAEPH
ncbi:hydroxymethylglutaryl-CoA lyase [Rhizobium sp. SSA_523]|uniref:hydroxymethylglutaryl-CoA lyase n=1 Tax=Rhizobium sp. SSA_523 TaxID=2952477 RepID=UPI0020902A0C|nr:hydroxymethylglutaryl-CoA lyase [Rhizobium sp. SSA_523]MCO5733229.1 hydroxymethylglutaryl-CoA lyase [Rhizobium sp. SSA_523]WKC21784.1 hydroxymethylglutaryl-CoA lyase [Rhizobium sp. SSA_523]